MSFDLSIDILYTFYIFSASANITAAAVKLKTTQPTVTRKLSLLEKNFKYPLFFKKGRDKKLTAFGIELAEILKTKFQALPAEINLLSLKYDNPDLMTLRIGGRREFLENFMAPIAFDGILDFKLLSSQAVVKHLKEGNLDMGLTHLEIDSASLSRIALKKDYPVLIVPKKYSSQAPDFKTWGHKGLKFPIVTYNKDMLFLKDYLKIIKSTEPIKVNFYFPHWHTVQERVHEGYGWSIIPALFARNDKNYWITQLPDEWNYSYTIYIYYKKELTRMPWFKKMLAGIKESRE